MAGKDYIELGERRIGEGYPCFIVAEAGVNHNGDLGMAHRLVDVAVAAGADAVKFQTLKAEKLVSVYAPKADYQRRTTDRSESHFAMIKRLELSPDAHRDLAAYCRQRGILFLSSPFDEAGADLLQGFNVPAFKIPSGELTNLPYLAYVARKGRPLFLSTGMADLEEVGAALHVIESSGGPPVVLLHCVSSYPAPAAEANLRAMETMRRAFDRPVGYSDHVPGNEVALAAAALGACVIEKHFTIDRTLPGPDHQASIEPEELQALVCGIRAVESALGHGRKEPAPCERDNRILARKCLVAAMPIAAGTVLTEAMIARKRTGAGLLPDQLPKLIGRRMKTAIETDAPFSWEMVEDA